jgi:quercetin dioxygenase-like cupin family protein
MTKPNVITEGVDLDLAAADRELRAEEAYQRDGHTARTLIREPAVRIVLVVMRAGAKIAQHQTQDTASISTIAGTVRFGLRARTVEVGAGRLLVIPPGLAHDVEAVGDSAFLLTLARGAQP